MVRKQYTISKAREKWTSEEHARFLEAIARYNRDWRKIVDFIKTRTVAQVCYTSLWAQITGQSAAGQAAHAHSVPHHPPGFPQKELVAGCRSTSEGSLHQAGPGGTAYRRVRARLALKSSDLDRQVVALPPLPGNPAARTPHRSGLWVKHQSAKKGRPQPIPAHPLQVRSHAQKHFLKLEKEGKGDEVPPARPKKRSARSGSAQGPSKAARTNAGRRQDTSGNSTSCKSISKSASVQLSTEEGRLGCEGV